MKIRLTVDTIALSTAVVSRLSTAELQAAIERGLRESLSVESGVSARASSGSFRMAIADDIALKTDDVSATGFAIGRSVGNSVARGRGGMR